MRRARKKQTPEPQQNSTPKKQRKERKKSGFRKFMKWFGISFGVLVLGVFIALGFDYGGNNALVPINQEDGRINVLLLGVDKEGLRTDTIMIASYNFEDDTLNLMSVPRDTRVRVKNRKVYRKINEVHAIHGDNGEILGPVGSAETVTQLTGIPIHYYIEFSFSAIDNFMDILGPVTFDVPDVEGNGQGMNYDDPYQDLHIHLKPGVQQLVGNQIQQFLRYRKSNNGTVDGSDLSRISRQQDLFKAVVEQKLNIGLLMKLPEIFGQMKKEIKTNVTVGDVASYVRYLTGFKSENIKTCQLPGEEKYVGGGWYFVMDKDATKTLVAEVFGYDVDPQDAVVVSAIAYDGSDEPEKEEAVEEEPEPTDEEEDEEETETPTPTPTREPEEPEEEEEPTPKPTKTPSPTPEPEPEPEPTPDTSEEEDDVITLD